MAKHLQNDELAMILGALKVADDGATTTEDAPTYEEVAVALWGDGPELRDSKGKHRKVSTVAKVAMEFGLRRGSGRLVGSDGVAQKVRAALALEADPHARDVAARIAAQVGCKAAYVRMVRAQGGFSDGGEK